MISFKKFCEDTVQHPVNDKSDRKVKSIGHVKKTTTKTRSLDYKTTDN